MKRVAVIFGILMIIGVFATVAIAQPGGGKGKRGHGFHGQGPHFWKNPQMVEKLGLTDEQLAQFEAISEGQKENVQAIHDEMRTAKQGLDEAIDSGDETAIESAKAEVSAAHDKMLDFKVAHKAEVSKILTEEQREMLQEYKGKCGGMGHGKGHGKGHGMGMGRGGSQGGDE
jgi:Spy/CpxP family protein refolding chaperone